MRMRLDSVAFAIAGLILFAVTRPVSAQVKPGDRIMPANAAQMKNLVSPGVYIAASKGMEIE